MMIKKLLIRLSPMLKKRWLIPDSAHEIDRRCTALRASCVKEMNQ